MKNFKRILAAALSFLFISLGSSAQFTVDNAATTGYYFKLKFETTSDWTQLRFHAQSDSFFLVHDTVLGNLAYNYNHYNDYVTNYFNIIRGDTVLTGVEYTLFYPELPANGIYMMNTKGWWGKTTVTATIRCNGNDVSMSLINTVGNDSLNTKILLFPFSFLQCADLDTLFLPSPAACPKMLAFYYPWYASPSVSGYWGHWNPVVPAYNAPDTPAIGYYDSNDYTIINAHIQWAKLFGLEGFVSSWWGVNDFTNFAIQKVFDVADTANFAITMYYEPGNIGSLPAGQKVSRCINDITYMVNTYGNRPAMMKHNGRPVIFIYGQTMDKLTLAQWEQVLAGTSSFNCIFIVEKGSPEVMRLFDGVHTYNPVFKSYYQLYGMNLFEGAHANLEGKIYCATMAPGFLTVSRNNGYTYLAQFAASLAYKPHYLLVTSFNEWHEASEIEPSLKYGFDYLNYTLSFRNYLDSICSLTTGVEGPANHAGGCVVFPNPFSSSGTLWFGNSESVAYELNILDMHGRIVRHYTNLTGQSVSIERGSLHSGIYFYSLTLDGVKKALGKFVIVRAN